MALLTGLDVSVRTGAKVAEVRADGVVLEGGEVIAAELVVWAAGVKAPDVLHEFGGLETNKVNQLVVRPTLQTTRDDDVFAIGDCASCVDERTGRPIPPRAQAAHQMASHMVAQVAARLKGKALTPFADARQLPAVHDECQVERGNVSRRDDHFRARQEAQDVGDAVLGEADEVLTQGDQGQGQPEQ